MSEEIRDILPEIPEVEKPEEENPDTPPENGEEPEVRIPLYSAKEWLSAKMQVLDEDGILAVLAERGIYPDTSFEELTEKERDLLMANGLLSQILLCGGGQTIKDVDGSWSHTEGGWQITKADKDAWVNLYNRLCDKWGEENLLPRKGFRIINL